MTNANGFPYTLTVHAQQVIAIQSAVSYHDQLPLITNPANRFCLPAIFRLEPDYCFYIDNWAAVSGKARINWGVDPAPDLVIEIDVTSYTDVNDYLPYRVPEVWLFKKNKLKIYSLQGDHYIIQTICRYFPSIDVKEVIDEC